MVTDCENGRVDHRHAYPSAVHDNRGAVTVVAHSISGILRIVRCSIIAASRMLRRAHGMPTNGSDVGSIEQHSPTRRPREIPAQIAEIGTAQHLLDGSGGSCNHVVASSTLAPGSTLTTFLRKDAPGSPRIDTARTYGLVGHELNTLKQATRAARAMTRPSTDGAARVRTPRNTASSGLLVHGLGYLRMDRDRGLLSKRG